MKKFLLNLLKPNSGTSSRRLIALSYLIPSIIGVMIGYFSKDFRYFLTSTIYTFLVLFMAYFSLSWETIVKLTTNIKDFFKKEESIVESTTNPLEPPI
jgi:hypothetical membrane protein